MPKGTTGPKIGRRRMFTILAAGIGAAAWPGAARADPLNRFTWTGNVLGAQASIVLYHQDRSIAQAAVGRCLAEIERLETEFSLYSRESALSRLNRVGRLEAPSHDMRDLLAVAMRFGDLSGGAFDISVQPLWQLMAAHFAAQPTAHSGPPAEQIIKARAVVDYRRIGLSPERITLAPGMALTLNGIAQGYITDRVADILRARGWSNVLIDLGEIRALDRRPDGQPWSVGLRAHHEPAGPPAPLWHTLALDNKAVATSAGSGTPFDQSGRHHHLLDPTSGESANTYRSVTVVAARATTADALSTALYLMPRNRAAQLLAAAGPTEAWLLHHDGTEEKLVS